MDATANLDLPFIMPSQAQKHITHNEAIARLDAVVQLAVMDRDLATPPASPADGDRYIVAAAATGAWTGWDLSVAVYYAGGWLRLTPQPGWLCWIADEAGLVYWTGSAWQPIAAANIGAVAKTGDTMTGGLRVTGDGFHFTSEVDGVGNPLHATKWIEGTGGPVFVGRKARGTKAVPAVPQSGDTIMGFRGYAYNGTGSDGFVSGTNGAAFLLEASETWDAAKTGTQIRFFVTPTGNAVIGDAVEHTRLASDGALQMGGANTVITASRHPLLRSYTIATLPTPAPAAQLIYVADGASNKRLAVSDGSNWRWPDGAVVS